MRYVFALFGSQGVSHFVAEVSCQNAAALSLLGSCGFRRSCRLTHYRLPAEPKVTDNSFVVEPFRLAIAGDRQALYQLSQDALPSDLRLIYDLSPQDFALKDLPMSTSEHIFKLLIKRKLWYWVAEDAERKVLTAAIKVRAHQQGDYHLEFAVHPGWQHTAPAVVSFMLSATGQMGMKGVLMAKAYDYQASIGQALEEAKMEKRGIFPHDTRTLVAG